MVSVLAEPISEFSTRRVCAVCPATATYTSFKGDAAGDFDKSSKQYRCAEHASTVTPDWKTWSERTTERLANLPRSADFVEMEGRLAAAVERAKRIGEAYELALAEDEKELYGEDYGNVGEHELS